MPESSARPRDPAGTADALIAGIDDADVRDFAEWCFWTGMRKGETDCAGLGDARPGDVDGSPARERREDGDTDASWPWMDLRATSSNVGSRRGVSTAR